LEDARLALSTARELGMPVTLASAPAAAGYAGVAWFERLISLTCAKFPDIAVTAILDCGDAPGDVLAAVRWLSESERHKLTLRFTGDAEIEMRVSDIVRQAGLDLIRDLPPVLDLQLAKDPARACRDWLTGAKPT
jgi:hypothetical protein